MILKKENNHHNTKSDGHLFTLHALILVLTVFVPTSYELIVSLVIML